MKKGEVLIPFVATLKGGRKVRPAQGDIIEIPPNVDWVKAGLVKIVELAPEPAVKTTPQPTVKTTAKKTDK